MAGSSVSVGVGSVTKSGFSDVVPGEDGALGSQDNKIARLRNPGNKNILNGSMIVVLVMKKEVTL